MEMFQFIVDVWYRNLLPFKDSSYSYVIEREELHHGRTTLIEHVKMKREEVKRIREFLENNRETAKPCQ
jgi:hypothetical protein